MERFGEEVAVMRPLSAAPFLEFEELTARVSQESTILARKKRYRQRFWGTCRHPSRSPAIPRSSRRR